MSAFAAMKYFDALEYVEQAEKLGIPNEVAKFQAREMEHLYLVTIDEAKKEIKEELSNKEFSTKQDLHETELRLLKEIESVRKEIELVRRELKEDIANLRYETLKFVIWTGCTVSAVILGGVFSILKLMLH